MVIVDTKEGNGKSVINQCFAVSAKVPCASIAAKAEATPDVLYAAASYYCLSILKHGW
jgi:hypothetical protein